MAQNNVPITVRDRNQLSAEEFQRKLYNWFEDRGLLSDLRAHLRRQMILALRDTSLSTHSANSVRQTASPKLQAINLLVAEFLLQQEYHYTLSVFTSEVPLLRNLPEFATSINNTVVSGRTSRSLIETFPRFQQRDVLDILEALGLSPNSEEGDRVYELYQNSQGESLFMCIIRSLPTAKHIKSKTDQEDGSLLSGEVEHQKRTGSPTIDLSVSQFEMFTEEIKAILLQSSLKSHHIVQLHEELRRLVNMEVTQVRGEEERRFQQQLVERERRIQAELTRHEDDIQQKLRDAEQRLVSQRQAIDADLDLKQRQLAELAAQLHQHQAEVTCRLRHVEERNKVLKKREKQLKELKEQEAAELDTKSSELELKQKQLDQEMKRLSEERETKDIVRRELEDSRQKLNDASHALGESQSEVAFLRELQRKCAHLHYAQEPSRTHEGQPGTSSMQDQTQQELVHNNGQEKHETTEKGQPTKADEMLLCLEQQNRDHEFQQSLVDNLLQELQQENSELRGHTRQQRLRIDELTTHATQLANQLEDAQTAIAVLSNRQPEFAYLPPGAGTITVPPLIAPGQQAPPPPPPPRVQDRAESTFHSRQLGAGEELSFAASQPQTPHHARIFHAQRGWHKKPPRRLVVHGTTSSDESSPTEEILQEARRRLRRLEEESEAVDRSYRNFRLRHSESLAATASVLFHPVGFRLPPTQQSGNPPSFAFQPEYIRSRSTLRPNTIYEQVDSSAVPSGRLSTFPLFSFSQASESNPFSLDSEQPFSLRRVLNASSRLGAVSNSMGAATNVPGEQFLYTNTLSNINRMEGRERYQVLRSSIPTTVHLPQPSSSRIVHPHNSESVVAVSSQQPLVSTMVYNTPQVSYRLESSTEEGAEEQDEMQVRKLVTPQNSTQTTKWSTTESEIQFKKLSSPQNDDRPESESRPPGDLPIVPSVESHPPKMGINLPQNMSTNSSQEEKTSIPFTSPHHHISTIQKIESSNSVTSPKTLPSTSTNIISNEYKMASTSSISKSTATSSEKSSKSHGGFTRTDMEFLSSTSVDVTVCKREDKPALISGRNDIQNDKGSSSKLQDMLPNIATLALTGHISEEEFADINQVHIPTTEQDEQNKQTLDTVASDSTMGSIFAELKDSDQFLQTSVCPSDCFSAIAVSSAPLQNISLSSVEISSDPPISAGEGSNKDDEEDFW